MSEKRENSVRTPAAAAVLRKQAEAQVRSMEPICLSGQSPEEIQRVLHELRVRQIELELENGALRRAQAEIEAGRARYSELYDLAPVGYLTLSEKGLILEANLTAATLLGTARSALVRQPIFRFIIKEDQDSYYLHRKQLFATGEPQEYELRLVRPDGTFFWALLTGTAAVTEDGAPVYRVMINDVTERKQAEEALRESETNYKSLADSGRVLIWTSGVDKLCNYFNQPWLEFTGRRFEQEAGNGWAEGVHPEDFQRCLTIYTGSFDRRESFSMEYRLRRADGQYRWLLDDGCPRYSSHGEFLGYLGYCFDITERKQVETALQLSNERLVEAQQTARIGDWEANIRTEELYWSQTIFDIFALDSQSFKPSLTAFYSAVHPDDRGLVLESEQRSEQTGVHDVVHRIIRPSGEIRFVHELARGYNDDQGKLIKLRGTVQDITERKQVEEALQINQALLNATGRMAHVGGWEIDLATQTVTWTEEVYRIHEVEADYEPKLNTAIEFYAPESRPVIEQAVQQAVEQGLPFDVQLQIITAKGNRRWVHAIGQAEQKDGKVARVSWTFQDITERRKAEEILRASLVEKETLLKEVHHRVKNNLASINGLISLQQDLLAEPAAISEFSGLSGRIHSMALVHEMLYQSETLSRIDLNDYFERLASQIRSLYDPSAKVNLKIAAKGVEMDLDHAIPCGLIVNEVVTNTFKYAFPEGKPRPGHDRCEITLKANWDGSAYTLAVSDNGVGLPPGFDWKASKSLGLQLVMLLGQRQLKGQIDLDVSAGTACRLHFVPKSQRGG